MRYTFRHVLMRDAVYDMQLRLRLRELHQRAAEAIEALHADNLLPHYADLAYHYGEAQLPDLERRYALLAGKRAAAEFANDEALRFLARALALCPAGETVTCYEILLTRERVYDLQGDRAAQQRDLQQLLDLAQEEQRGEVWLRQTQYAETVGTYAEAVETAQQAIALAQTYQHADIESRAYLYWGRVEWRQGQYQEAFPLFTRALELARRVGLRSEEADALRNLGNVCWALGRYDEALLRYQEALSQYRALDHKRGESATFNNISIVLQEQGNYLEARVYGERALRLKLEIGDRIGASIAYSSLGDIALQFGQYDEAATCYAASLSLGYEAGDLPGQCAGQFSWAQLSLRQGDFEAAHAFGQRALELARVGNDLHRQGEVLLWLGHTFFDMGAEVQAIPLYRESLALRRTLQQPHLAVEPLAGLAHALLLDRQILEAQSCVEELLAYLLRFGAAPQQAVRALQGAREPARVYWSVYRILSALADARAETVLRLGYARLTALAAKISDPALHSAFWEKVSLHRDLRAAWLAFLAGSAGEV